MASETGQPGVDQQLERFTFACRQKGLPVTHQRLAVYRALLESSAHPDAEAVFRALRPLYPTLSLGTVYKTIEMLEGLELVREVAAPGSSRRFDANRHPHHHLWCVRCRRLIDIAHESLEGIALPDGLDFQVADYTIQFNGICADCRMTHP